MNKTIATIILLLITTVGKTQLALPPSVPIWDANKVELQLQKISEDIYAIIPVTAAAETTKGIPQATTGGIIIGDKGVILVECMLNKRLFDQEMKLLRSVTNKPILFAINTSDHGDHCFTDYLLPASTMIIQNDFAKENLSKNFEGIKQFMVTLFGKGRGIEEAVYRPADITIAKNNDLTIDLGKGKIIQLMNRGTAQSPADLFVWMPNQKILWAGNPFIAESPAIPWLFDGFFLEPADNLQKLYDFLPDEAIIVPGHGSITTKKGISYTVGYVSCLKKLVTAAVEKKLTLDETKKIVTMTEWDKGYELFHWLHFNFNLPNAYNDIKSLKK